MSRRWLWLALFAALPAVADEWRRVSVDGWQQDLLFNLDEEKAWLENDVDLVPGIPFTRFVRRGTGTLVIEFEVSEPPDPGGRFGELRQTISARLRGSRGRIELTVQGAGIDLRETFSVQVSQEGP